MRYCKYCDKHKPDDRFAKGRAKCRDCQAAAKRDLRKGIHHPVKKPDKKICKCGRTEDEIKFKSAGKCMICHKEYMKDYRKNNRPKLSKQNMDWKNENREDYRKSNREYYATPKGKSMHVARVEKTPRSWLSKLVSTIKSISKKPGAHDPKSGPRRDYDIDLNYVMEVWESQDGKCAITNLPMHHRYNDPYTASVDRINSQEGHVRGNIQLVCQCINRMKNNHSNDEMIAFLEAYKEKSSGNPHH